MTEQQAEIVYNDRVFAVADDLAKGGGPHVLLVMASTAAHRFRLDDANPDNARSRSTAQDELLYYLAKGAVERGPGWRVRIARPIAFARYQDDPTVLDAWTWAVLVDPDGSLHMPYSPRTVPPQTSSGGWVGVP